MSSEISGFTLFCEGILFDDDNKESLVSVFPQGIIAPKLPMTLPKLGVYARLNVSRDWDQGTITCNLKSPDGSVQEVSIIDGSKLDEIRAQTDDSYDFLGITLSTVRSIELTKVGSISLTLRYNGNELTVGTLNVGVEPPTPSPHTD